ncbi:hypothetical protein PG996_000111 [Apiospora saccharicola]|uniref:Uncharacterized protein n=1 Tax=Apiospora saccharicola TaxID=335842 RepID=A0ABR1WCU7_9PEZI
MLFPGRHSVGAQPPRLKTANPSPQTEKFMPFVRQAEQSKLTASERAKRPRATQGYNFTPSNGRPSRAPPILHPPRSRQRAKPIDLQIV